MKLRVSCRCGQHLWSKQEFGGRRARCPQCGALLVLPRQMTGNSLAAGPSRECGVHSTAVQSTRGLDDAGAGPSGASSTRWPRNLALFMSIGLLALTVPLGGYCWLTQRPTGSDGDDRKIATSPPGQTKRNDSSRPPSTAAVAAEKRPDPAERGNAKGIDKGQSLQPDHSTPAPRPVGGQPPKTDQDLAVNRVARDKEPNSAPKSPERPNESAPPKDQPKSGDQHNAKLPEKDEWDANTEFFTSVDGRFRVKFPAQPKVSGKTVAYRSSQQELSVEYHDRLGAQFRDKALERIVDDLQVSMEKKWGKCEAEKEFAKAVRADRWLSVVPKRSDDTFTFGGGGTTITYSQGTNVAIHVSRERIYVVTASSQPYSVGGDTSTLALHLLFHRSFQILSASTLEKPGRVAENDSTEQPIGDAASRFDGEWSIIDVATGNNISIKLDSSEPPVLSLRAEKGSDKGTCSVRGVSDSPGGRAYLDFLGLPRRSSFVLDSKANPQGIDFVPTQGRTLYGIIKFKDKNKLLLCISTAARPRVFEIIGEQKGGYRALITLQRKRTVDRKPGEGSDAREKWPFTTPIPKGYAFKGHQILETRGLIPGIQPLPKYRVFILRSEEIGDTQRTLLVIRPADGGKEVPLHMDFPRWAAEISAGLSPDEGFGKNSLTIRVPPKRSDNFHVLNFDIEAERGGRQYPKSLAIMIISSNYSTPYAVVGAGLATEAEIRKTADSVNGLTDALKKELGVVIDEESRASGRDKPQDAENSKKDKEMLQGTWSATTISLDAPGFIGFGGEAAQKLMRWIVEGDTVTIKGEGKDGGLAYQVAWKQDRLGLFALDQAKELKFALDFSKKPNAIDIKQGNTTLPGIYSLENGELKVCIDLSGKKRPKEFEGKKGTTHALFVLKKTIEPRRVTLPWQSPSTIHATK